MKIAVNTRLLLHGKMEGIGWFTYETLIRITRQHPEHMFYFIFDRPYSKEFIFSENIIPVVAGPPSRHPFLWYIWFNWSLARVLRKIKPDIFFSPEGYICLNSNVKTLNVMHDIAYEHYPETVPPLVKKYYKFYFPKFAKKADRIATVSEFSKRDIVNLYHADPSKIDVIYNGVNGAYGPMTVHEQEAARQKWSDGKPYFVYLGGINPRKNIKNLLLAFDSFKTSHPSETKLLLIGKKGFGYEALEKILLNLNCRDDVKFLGRVDDIKEVNRIVSGSIALTYVSVFEGFGIPCLEAMRCGTAVITSRTSAMPEVCGKDAIYVDPQSINAIAEAMQALSSDLDLRNLLVNNGFIRSLEFSWQKTSDLLWKTIETVLKS